jgi:hypothetical protein
MRGIPPASISISSRATEGDIMSKPKLRLEEVRIESFETTTAAEGTGTVRANEALQTPGEGTCLGQTAVCTACPPRQCF